MKVGNMNLGWRQLRLGLWMVGIGLMVGTFSTCNQSNINQIDKSKTVPAQPGIAFFEGTWSEVVAEAKSHNKYIFLDAYAEWCSPCKWMEKNIFTKESVGKFYNEKFISYRMDMEKGDGIELYKTYNLTGYPSYLFFGPGGNNPPLAGVRKTQKINLSRLEKMPSTKIMLCLPSKRSTRPLRANQPPF